GKPPEARMGQAVRQVRTANRTGTHTNVQACLEHSRKRGAGNSAPFAYGRYAQKNYSYKIQEDERGSITPSRARRRTNSSERGSWTPFRSPFRFQRAAPCMFACAFFRK